MDDLSPNTRALLDAARSFDDPSDSDRDRVRAGVMMRIGGVAAIGTAAITAAKSSSAAASAAPLIASSLTSTTIFTGVIAKVGVAVVLAGAVASGAYVALRPAHRAPAAQVAVAAVAAPAVVAPVAAPIAATDPAPVGVDPEDLPLDDSKPSAAHLGHARSADLEGEMKLLRTADAALRRGDSAAALAALNKHAALYPTGVLSQEREGVRAIALCSGGNLGQGQSAAQRFLAHAAKSPLASRIRSACSLGE